MVALLSFTLVTRTRSGNGSLHVMTAGSGKRPSKVIFGGLPALDVLGLDHWRKKPGLASPSIFGANWYWTRAYDSRRLGGARGGSIGRKLKTACYSIVSVAFQMSVGPRAPVLHENSLYKRLDGEQ